MKISGEDESLFSRKSVRNSRGRIERLFRKIRQPNGKQSWARLFTKSRAPAIGFEISWRLQRELSEHEISSGSKLRLRVLCESRGGRRQKMERRGENRYWMRMRAIRIPGMLKHPSRQLVVGRIRDAQVSMNLNIEEKSRYLVCVRCVF